MINLSCDYTRSACKEVLDALSWADGQYSGYSEDELCAEAREMVRELCESPDADVHFLVGGTQTNMTFISSALRPHQGVVCADTGHINVHETGAIESLGHKVLSLSPSLSSSHRTPMSPSISRPNGKLTAEDIEAVAYAHRTDPNFEHIVQPGMVYISNPTELGTIYSLAELTEISETCHRNNLILYLDGARLAYGLASPDNDLTLPAIARLTDAFYIGGTKCGALFGESLVITNPALKSDFRYIMKQRGALLAKGFLLGAQFLALLPVLPRYAAHAISEAQRIRHALLEANVTLYIDSPTNQIFPVLKPDSPLLQTLKEQFILDPWPDDTYRITTDWSTRSEDVDLLIESITGTVL